MIWTIIIVLVILIYLFLLGMIWFEREESSKIGYLADYLYLTDKNKYSRYITLTKIYKNSIDIRISETSRETYRVNDIMLLGTLNEGGMTEVVFYPGTKSIIVTEDIDSIIKKIKS